MKRAATILIAAVLFVVAGCDGNQDHGEDQITEALDKWAEKQEQRQKDAVESSVNQQQNQTIAELVKAVNTLGKRVEGLEKQLMKGPGPVAPSND